MGYWGIRQWGMQVLGKGACPLVQHFLQNTNELNFSVIAFFVISSDSEKSHVMEQLIFVSDTQRFVRFLAIARNDKNPLK
jgi:hypothetical protein